MTKLQIPESLFSPSAFSHLLSLSFPLQSFPSDLLTFSPSQLLSFSFPPSEFLPFCPPRKPCAESRTPVHSPPSHLLTFYLFPTVSPSIFSPPSIFSLPPSAFLYFPLPHPHFRLPKTFSTSHLLSFSPGRAPIFSPFTFDLSPFIPQSSLLSPQSSVPSPHYSVLSPQSS